MTKSFAEQIAGFAEMVPDIQLRIYRRAVQLLAEEMNKTDSNGGSLPHLTGNLMRSFLASKGSLISQGGAGDEYAGVDVGIVIAVLELEETLYLGWQAAYARRMNSGFVGDDKLGRTYDQAGRHFVEKATAMWPALVEQAAREIKGT